MSKSLQATYAMVSVIEVETQEGALLIKEKN
jgi:hypothetical protein